jgi:hypothetical protein
VASRPFAEDLEVALSGGGFRATAFCLGVLLYLAHSGLNRRIKTLVSVSGGSIASGFVAAHCDLGAVNHVNEFRPIAARLARIVCGRGRYSGFWLVSRPYLVLLGIIGAGLFGWFTTIVIAAVASMLWHVQLRPFSVKEVAALAFGALLWGIFALLRTDLVLWWLRRSFFRDGAETLADVSGRRIDHVFCATDLTRSCPIFFSTKGSGRLFSEAYGRGDGSDVPLTIAVGSSAAFPPAIAPLSLLIHHRRFTGRRATPRRIWLSDGGVWNNLGTDWSRLRSDVLTAERDWTERFESDHIKVITQSVENCPAGGVLIMANASKPDEGRNLWALKIPVLSFVLTLTRVLDVAVNSTIAGRSADVERIARTRMLNNPDRWELDAPRPASTVWGEGVGTDPPLAVLVEMTRAPGDTARAYRMVGGLRQWTEKPDAYLQELGRSLPDLQPLIEGEGVVPTTLDNIGRRDTLRMIVLGYLNAREALTVAFINHQPPSIPQRQWFEELLDDQSLCPSR